MLDNQTRMREMLNILTESEQPKQQLNEGIVDTLTQKAKSLMAKVPKNSLAKISELVEKALGKSVDQLSMADLTMDNIKKVVAMNNQLAEDKSSTTQWDSDREYAEVPGSLDYNKKGASTIGGILSVIGSVGTLGMFNIPGWGPLMIAGAISIIIAMLARSLVNPDYVRTGRRKDEKGNIYTADEWYDKEHDPDRYMKYYKNKYGLNEDSGFDSRQLAQEALSAAVRYIQDELNVSEEDEEIAYEYFSDYYTDEILDMFVEFIEHQVDAQNNGDAPPNDDF